jgi:hypothetical protein
MGWQSFDDWQARQGLRYADAPVQVEERLSAAEDGRVKRSKPPSDRCRSRHRHAAHKPSKACQCYCDYCQVVP